MATNPTTNDNQARDVGERVLAGLERGRARVNAARKFQATETRELVRLYADQDAEAGYPKRGRAQRIALMLHGKVSQSTVYRHFSALYSSGKSSD